MSCYILDTSVAIAWYIDEVFSDTARHYQSQLIKNQDRFYVPNLHYWEFANVLRTLVLKKILSPETAENIYALHLQAPLNIIEPDRENILETALTYQATTYDAVFIQLSVATGFPLLTTEKKARGWVSKMGDQAVTVS